MKCHKLYLLVLPAVQVPHLSGIEVSKQSLIRRGVPQSLRLFVAGLHDRARALIGLPPAYLKVAGPHGSNAFMELSPEDMGMYFAKHPEHYLVCPLLPVATLQVVGGILYL